MENEIVDLTGKQKRHLRALGSQMDAIVHIGKGGISPDMVTGAAAALLARELIKVRVLKNASYEPAEAIKVLAEETGAHVVQVIGRNGLLYKKNPEKMKIELP